MANLGERNAEDDTAQSNGRRPRVILSRELLGNDKLVIIRHEREEYRLRVTATGKLILTK
jgi:hemin uptake protein HemP